jgi:signal transduction histidine kinase
MAGEVRRRDAEIRAFNVELQARVDQRTAELHDAQAQIARSQRLTALGSLSAGVAHGLNDPMTAMVGLVTLAREEAGAGSPQGDLLGSALAEARRVTGVIRDLRRLASPGLASGARRFELGRPVLAALERFRAAAAGQGVELRTELGQGLPPMEGDPEQLESLVARLVENALDATPRGGHVTVSTSAVDGAALRLVVADDGRGIPAADLERIFDPFYTVGEAGGAGLGLTLVQGHHGSIRVESAEGRGTTLTLHFPAASPPPA